MGWFGLKWAMPLAAETGQLGVSLPAMRASLGERADPGNILTRGIPPRREPRTIGRLYQFNSCVGQQEKCNTQVGQKKEKVQQSDRKVQSNLDSLLPRLHGRADVVN